jgi:hypothetical protein
VRISRTNALRYFVDRGIEDRHRENRSAKAKADAADTMDEMMHRMVDKAIDAQEVGKNPFSNAAADGILHRQPGSTERQNGRGSIVLLLRNVKILSYGSAGKSNKRKGSDSKRQVCAYST